jgi:hypothetical protein
MPKLSYEEMVARRIDFPTYKALYEDGLIDDVAAERYSEFMERWGQRVQHAFAARCSDESKRIGEVLTEADLEECWQEAKTAQAAVNAAADAGEFDGGVYPSVAIN